MSKPSDPALGSSPPPAADDSSDSDRRSVDRLDTITEDFAKLLGRRSAKAGELIGGKYRLVQRLGAGAMGEVWAATNMAIDLKVAVKLLKRDLLTDKHFRIRFQREAQAIASVAHPNVARFFDVVVGDPTFMVMEFVEGRSLKGVLEKETQLAPERALSLAIGIARALEAVHAAGVVHRDLKPSNIMLTTGADGIENPRVIDFGLAKVTRSDDGLTQPGQIVGTPDYMSPEQIAGHAVDARTDVYALGCVLYRMLTGRAPFAGEPVEVLYKHVHSAVPQVGNIAGVSPALAALVSKSLAKLPADRFKTATAMLQELERIAAENKTAQNAMSQLRELGANKALMILGGLLLVTGFLAGLGLGRRSGGVKTAAGTLLIVDTHPGQARVTIDGQELAEPTPTALRGLAFGDHELKLSAAGYEEAVRKVTIGMQGRASISVTLTPATRRVEVRTRPPGATVFVDDDPVANTTPAQIALKEGDFHAVRVEKTGYETATRSVRPEDQDKLIAIDLVAEKLARGALLVDANLTGEVWVDGAYTGFVTPTLAMRLSPGKHLVELRAPDGAKLDQTVVRLGRGETRRLFMSASGR